MEQSLKKNTQSREIRPPPSIFLLSCCYSSQGEQLHGLIPAQVKEKKFISLKIKPRKLHMPAVPDPIREIQSQKMLTILKSGSIVKDEVFHEDKLTFLQQIRKYSPSSGSKQWEQQHLGATLDSSKQCTSSKKSSENGNLSSLIECLNRQLFSENSYSQAVRSKIEVVSNSLRSISEVKSEMERSLPTETIANVLQIGDEQ